MSLTTRDVLNNSVKVDNLIKKNNLSNKIPLPKKFNNGNNHKGNEECKKQILNFISIIL